jgi:hypothetical protein
MPKPTNDRPSRVTGPKKPTTEDAKAKLEQQLDEALEATFPASDPFELSTPDKQK